MYFICENKQVIAQDVHCTNAYRHRKHAEQILAQMHSPVKVWKEGKPPVTYSVEGFYLLHESLFEETEAPSLKIVRPQ